MMLKRKVIFIIAMSFFVGINANADTIKFKVPACISDDLLNEFTRYIIDQDEQGMIQLIDNGDCIVLIEGDKVSTISRRLSTSTIRVLGNKYYLASEAIEQDIEKESSTESKINSKSATQKSSSPPKKGDTASKFNSDVGKFTIQAISTGSKVSAEKITIQLQELGYDARTRMIVLGDKTIYRVFTQPFKEREDAIAAKQKIEEILKIKTIVMPIKQ